MMDGDDIAAIADRVRIGFRNAYGIKASRLDDAVKKAGRRLPHEVQRHAGILVHAEQMNGHPKLLRQLDPKRLLRAEKVVERHLTSIDRGAMRRTAAMNWLAQVSMYLFIVFGGLLTWAILTGRI